MKSSLILYCWFIFFTGIISCKKERPLNNTGTIQVMSAKIGASVLSATDTVKNVPVDQPVRLSFSNAIDTSSVQKIITIKNSSGFAVNYTYTIDNSFAELSLTPVSVLQNITGYTLSISSSLRGKNRETFPGVKFQFITSASSMVIDSISLNGKLIGLTTPQNIYPGKIEIHTTFSKALDPNNYKSFFSFTGPALSYSLTNGNKTVIASTIDKGQGLTRYVYSISSSLTSAGGDIFGGYSSGFYTGIDSTYKFPLISDDALLTLVQSQTFKYFWDLGHPSCGLARERNSSGDVVTIGGSGFGVMSIIVAMERGFISRADGLARLDKILAFLETCDRFHGVWPHWLNGITGKTVPFSAHDNGGDLVETSYMIQGLLCMRQYLDSAVTAEKTEIKRINDLFNSVEFDWFTNGESTLYWQWSPDYGYILKIQGYNECLITYIVAASSPSHSISKAAYTSGYAGNGSIINGQSYYGYALPLGQPYGGPLFFTQYSFLGLDPRHLSDQYADYWVQNVDQSLINWAYCQADPKKFPGYGGGIWGLTSSDNPWGYSAHSPTNDLGVITPTAAISSIAYTPSQSMDALRTFYYFLGNRLWGDYGFYDAFDVETGWWANSTLAIDQGPIICMIENYRTGLLWKLFMSAPEVQTGLKKLGFTY